MMAYKTQIFLTSQWSWNDRMKPWDCYFFHHSPGYHWLLENVTIQAGFPERKEERHRGEKLYLLSSETEHGIHPFHSDIICGKLVIKVHINEKESEKCEFVQVLLDYYGRGGKKKLKITQNLL